MSKLADILPKENDHSFLCSVGNWYWSLRHGGLAKIAYERSIEICPEAPTFFNLAVCCDDLGDKESARNAMTEFYQLVSSREEMEQAEAMLRRDNKDHLVRS